MTSSSALPAPSTTVPFATLPSVGSVAEPVRGVHLRAVGFRAPRHLRYHALRDGRFRALHAVRRRALRFRGVRDVDLRAVRSGAGP